MENKWQLIKHETDKDFVYEITNGPISLCVNEDDMPGEDYGEDIPILNQVVDALNKSGIPFHSENKLELDQHITIMEQSYEIDELQAKTDRYEAALKWYADEGNYFGDNGELATAWKNKMPLKANEALSSGEGETIEKTEITSFLRWLTRDSFLELIGGQWTAKGDVNSDHPFEQHDIIDMYANHKEDKQ